MTQTAYDLPHLMDAALDRLAGEHPEAHALVASIHPLASTTDKDLAWAVARVIFAVGHTATRAAPNTEEIRAQVEALQLLERAKATQYYRIGDSTWTPYVIAAVWPTPEACAWLFPTPPPGHTYRLDPSVPIVLLDDKPVPWPPFEPPPLALLASPHAAQRNASGFVPEALAVPGNARLPIPTQPHASA